MDAAKDSLSAVSPRGRLWMQIEKLIADNSKACLKCHLKVNILHTDKLPILITMAVFVLGNKLT